MRGSRFPLPGYALPALSPKKKHCKRNKHQGCERFGDFLFARKVHSPEACCKAMTMSILEISVTCDTKWHPLGRIDALITQPGLMSSLGWRSSKHMLFLATGTLGPDEYQSNKWRGTGAQRLRVAKDKRDKERSRKNSSPRRRWRGPRAHADSRFVCSVLQLCMYSTDTLHPSP